MIRRSPAHLMRHLVDEATPELVLVSEADFIAAQDVNAADRSAPQGGPVLRRYLLAGLLACGVCGRRMESAWSNGRAGVPVSARPCVRAFCGAGVGIFA
jgi:hypothetical protein